MRSDGAEQHWAEASTSRKEGTAPLKEVNAINSDVDMMTTPVIDPACKKRPASDSKCYTRRRRRRAEEEEEEVIAPSTCPTFSTKRRRDDSSSIENEPHSSLQARKTKALKVPREFVQEQQKYFAEVDAFELQEADSGSE